MREMKVVNQLNFRNAPKNYPLSSMLTRWC